MPEDLVRHQLTGGRLQFHEVYPPAGEEHEAVRRTALGGGDELVGGAPGGGDCPPEVGLQIGLSHGAQLIRTLYRKASL